MLANLSLVPHSLSFRQMISYLRTSTFSFHFCTKLELAFITFCGLWIKYWNMCFHFFFPVPLPYLCPINFVWPRRVCICVYVRATYAWSNLWCLPLGFAVYIYLGYDREISFLLAFFFLSLSVWHLYWSSNIHFYYQSGEKKIIRV